MLGKGQKPVADGVARGVVPGNHQQDEEGRHFRRRERLTVDVAVDEGRGDVIGRVAPARLGQVRHQSGELLRSLQEGHQGIGVGSEILGITGSRKRVGGDGDHVGGAQDRGEVRRADAHHAADDLEREPCRHLDHEVASALCRHAIDDLVGHQLDLFLDALDHAGAEGGRDDPAQLGVARIVGVDHGAEVLQELFGHIGDTGGALARLVDLGMPAHLGHVGVAGHGAVARPLGHEEGKLGNDRGLLEVGQRVFPTQKPERALALVPRELPERNVRQVDLLDRQGLTGFHATQPTGVAAQSSGSTQGQRRENPRTTQAGRKVASVGIPRNIVPTR